MCVGLTQGDGADSTGDTVCDSVLLTLEAGLTVQVTLQVALGKKTLGQR